MSLKGILGFVISAILLGVLHFVSGWADFVFAGSAVWAGFAVSAFVYALLGQIGGR